MPSYVRTRLLAAREFAIDELEGLRSNHPAYDTSIIDTLRHFVPFEYYFFSGVDLDNCRTGTNLLLLSNMPELGVQEYHNSGLVESDPLITLVSPDRPVMAWSEVPETELRKPKVQALVRLLNEHHIPPRLIVSQWNRQGVFYGLAGYARQKPFTLEETAMLTWFSNRIHHDLCEPVLTGFNQRIGLSNGERACIELASKGRTSEEISKDLKLSTETVNSYIKIASRKLGARNRTHAIADALRLGIIE
ncbi:LuxR C-terminal-related transcriptional regulator [Asticcacaulis sp. BYS171W]|uniref:LuxR C-terminal-related transcriptional regulator n=1 Tax=Asticcacaulis aquaticus TaxID=2984212 RepID=A0ABT5HZ19_9CAUL|nr:LuxR family transcriptional regulator [Asticcacaulis aquaticus]MDC7685263.1 LuxR C-terminal-related transcriptional regulator [Asticcacaulis aquaticus]